MSEAKKRKLHSSEFKAKVGLEALRGGKTINKIGQAHEANNVAYRKEQLRRASKSRVDSLFRLEKLAPRCKTWRAWKTLSWSAFWRFNLCRNAC